MYFFYYEILLFTSTLSFKNRLFTFDIDRPIIQTQVINLSLGQLQVCDQIQK